MIINGLRWKFRKVPPASLFLQSPHGHALGACDKPSLTIYLNKNLKGKKLQDVICHEIVHATLFSYNINLSYDNEEIIAMIIATYGNQIIEQSKKIYKKIRGTN